MIKLLKNVSNKIGIDSAIAFTILSRIIQAGGGVITLLFVAKFLTKIEQGYYYTFGSILAIQIFFELGLSGIITQFVAHENANFVWHSKVSFSGSEESSSRLASLLKFTIKWFAVISVLLFFGLLLAGYYFFSTYGKVNIAINWQIPWVILAITTSLTLMTSPILAFIEGLGRIKEVARVRMIQQIVQLSFVIVLFSLGLKLFSAPIAAFASFLVVPFWIFFGYKIKLLSFIWQKIGNSQVNYRSEIFPFQWKIALSWISGYFIFQLFNPVLFATDGPIVAGQMGMTLMALNGVMSISMSWMSTKVPLFSGLIALKDYNKLDSVFNKTLIQSFFINAFGLFLLIAIVFIMRHYDIKIGNSNFAERFLPFTPMIFLMVTISINHIVFSLATYLRCHKKEPMLLQSVVIGVLCSLSTITLGHYFGVLGITAGYLILTIISFVWTIYIFITKKRLWHVI